MKRTVLFFCILAITSIAQAQTPIRFADQGTGSLANQICWFDWNGFSMTNNANRVFQTPDGLTVSITFTNVASAPLPHIMRCWTGSVLWSLYDYSDAAYRPALYDSGNNNTSTFTMTINATRNGNAVPFTFVGADAEASAPNNEVTTFVTTGGSNWTMLALQRANCNTITDPLGGTCNTNTVNIVNTYCGAAGAGQSPVVSTTSSTGSLVVDVTMNKNGITGGMAVAFGVTSPIDRGDLPSGYGFAQHGLDYQNTNSCNFQGTLPGRVQTTNLFLGAVAPDADLSQGTNDNASGVDEEAITAFPAYTGSGSYTLTIPVSNTTGASATVAGWFDFDRDGSFSSGERAATTVANNGTSATLTWTGIPASLAPGSVADFGFRFRISPNGTALQNATGFAENGEVEDYLVVGDSLMPVCPEECDWTLTGNSIQPYNFIGTKNSQPFNIRTNNQQRMTISAAGSVGIATTTPTAMLHTVGTVRHENLPSGNYYLLTIDANGNLYRSDCTYGCRLGPVDPGDVGERLNALEQQIRELKGGVKSVDKIQIEQNQPNPFGESTVFRYSIPSNVQGASLNIYNLEGKQLNSYRLTSLGKGSIEIKANDLSSGIYLAMILGSNGATSETIKMVIAR